MERLLEGWGPFAAFASTGLMVVHSFVPFPAEMLAIADGMLFGPVWGTIITWVGAMLGAFGTTRALARRFVSPHLLIAHAAASSGGSERLHPTLLDRVLEQRARADEPRSEPSDLRGGNHH